MVKVVSTQGLGRVTGFGDDLYGWAVAETDSEKPAEKHRTREKKRQRQKLAKKKGGVK